MTVDFTLSAEQREARAATRQFADEQLSGIEGLFEGLATPEERLLATRPIYQEFVKAGYLRGMILPTTAAR